MASPMYVRRALGGLGLCLFLALLQVVPASGLVSEAYLPTFSTMLRALIDDAASPVFWAALGHTLAAWSVGLAVAMLAGVAAGITIGSVPFLRTVTASTIEFLRPIPSVALIPLVVLVLGIRVESVLALVIYAAFWQVLVQVLYGVQHVDPVVRDTARSFRFSRFAVVKNVVWPTALPFILTGFRLAATVALILTITSELIIGSPGVGEQIAIAQSAGNVDHLYGLVVLTGALGVLVNVGTRLLEGRALHWHVSQREAVVS